MTLSLLRVRPERRIPWDQFFDHVLHYEPICNAIVSISADDLQPFCQYLDARRDSFLEPFQLLVPWEGLAMSEHYLIAMLLFLCAIFMSQHYELAVCKIFFYIAHRCHFAHWQSDIDLLTTYFVGDIVTVFAEILHVLVGFDLLTESTETLLPLVVNFLFHPLPPVCDRLYLVFLVEEMTDSASVNIL